MSEANNSIDIFTRLFGAQEVAKSLEGLYRLLEQLAKGSMNADEAQRQLVGALRETTGALDKAIATTEKDTAATDTNVEAKAKRIQALFDESDAILKETVATEEETAATKSNTDATVVNTAATRESIMAKAAAESIEKRFAISLMATNVQVAAADRAFGPFLNRLHSISEMGTPEIMKAATWAAFGVGGAIYEGMKKFMQFNREMTLSVTQAGVALSRLPALSKGVLNISTTTGTNAQDLAQTFYRIASGTASWNGGAGVSNSQLLGFTDAIAKMSVIGNINGPQQEQIGRVVMAIANSNLRGTGTDPYAAAAATNALSAAGDVRPGDLLAALGRGVLVAAQQHQMSLLDAGSWIDLLTLHGTSTNVAGTYVKSGINMLFNPSTQGALGYAMIGISTKMLQDAQKKSGILGVADLINKHLDIFQPFTNFPKYKGKTGNAAAMEKLLSWTANQMPADVMARWKTGHLTDDDKKFITSTLFTKMFGGARGYTTIASLTAYADQLRGIFNFAQEHSTQAFFNQSYQTTMKTPSAQWNKFKAQISKDFIDLGARITPTVLSIAKGMMHMFDAFTKFKPLLWEVSGIAMMLAGYVVVAKTAKMFLAFKKFQGGLQEWAWRHGSTRDVTYAQRLYRAESRTWKAKWGDMALKTGQTEMAAADIEKSAADTFAVGATKVLEAGEMMASSVADMSMMGATGAVGAASKTEAALTRKELRAARDPIYASKVAAKAQKDAAKAEAKAARAAEKAALKRERETLRSMRSGYRSLYEPVGFVPGRVARREKLTYTNLSDTERRIAAREAQLGRKLSRTELAAEMGYGLDARGRSWKTMTEEQRQAVEDARRNIDASAARGRAPFFKTRAVMGDVRAEAMPRARIALTAAGERIGSAATRVAEVGASAASKVAGAASRFGTMLTGGAGLMGFLGGPFGMMAMSLLPMAMPFIAKGIGGLINWFSGGPPPPPPKPMHTKTMSDFDKRVKDAKAKLAQDEAKLAAGNYSKTLRRDIQRQTNIIAAATDKGQAKKVGTRFAQRYIGLVNAAETIRKLGLSEKDFGSMDLVAGVYSKNGQTFVNKSLRNAFKGLTGGQKIMYNKIFMKRGAMIANQWLINSLHDADQQLSDPIMMKAVKDAGLLTSLRRAQSHSTIGRMVSKAQALLRDKDLYNKLYARGNYQALTLAEGGLAKQFKDNQARLTDKTLSADAKKALNADQAKIKAEIGRLREAEVKVATKGGIKGPDAKAMADAMAVANEKVFKTLGLSKKDFEDAVANGVARSGGSLTQAITGQIYNNLLRPHK